MQDLKAELAEMVDEAEWEWLIPHAKRDALILVSQALSLVDVGAAIANDDVSAVQQWIGTQQIYKPSPEQLATWGQDQTHRFNALIVQPYVLVQDRA
ncbi:MAG TPA: DUF2288 domain-containing protein [Trichocoleus sp.]|jgi:hypothetical protein